MHGLAGPVAQEFIQNVLVSGLGAQYVLVGDDFRFGAAGGRLRHARRRHGRKPRVLTWPA